MTTNDIDVASSEAETTGLFGAATVETPSDDTMQWRASLLQLVNWGGFEGLTTVPLRGDATMISGASGVGKSTILDAYTALMMPSDTKFNGASNDAVGGRARGAGQRNLLSYLRGAVDVVDDPKTGRPIEKLLRGQGSDTWGAVAMTFVNDQGGSFTALRTYYVPRRATRSADVSMQLATLEGALALDTLEVAVPDRFHANTLKKLYPGLRVHRTYSEFATVLYARLGIGSNSDGSKALRLLARIQAGNHVRSVDELYKEMVLERPSTYAAADRAIAHFDDLEAAYTAMRTEQAKLELLTSITDLHTRKVAAEARIVEFDAFGVTDSRGDSPLQLWLLKEHLRLLTGAVDTNRDERKSTADALASTTAAEAALIRDVEDAKEAHRAAGGSTLQSLALSIESESVVRATRADRRDELAARLLPLLDAEGSHSFDIHSALESAGSFAQAQSDARAWLDQWHDQRTALSTKRDQVRDSLVPVKQRQNELRSERESMQSRAGRMPARMHEMRAEVAEASGIGVENLPFVAELIDVSPDQAQWRIAVETVLGSSARMMLVPADRLEQFSAAIDGLHLRGRLVFEGAELDLPVAPVAEDGRIAGKLNYKDSRFAGWVQRHMAEPSRNALCVAGAEGLVGDGFRVTPSGQTRNGRRGAHGRNDLRNIIGFSNEEALAEIDTELAALEGKLVDIDTQIIGVDREVSVLDRLRTVYEAVGSARYDDIDVASAEARIADLERRRNEILDSDNQLQVLDAQIAELTQNLDETRKRRFDLDRRQRELNTAHLELVDSEDLVKDRLDTLELGGSIEISQVQDDALRAEFVAAVAPGNPDDLDRFHENSQRLAERLRGAVGEAEAEIGRVEDEMVAIFRLYKIQWESPNLGSSADSYPDYARILEEIKATGLASRRTEWRRRLTEWSGQDLVPLVSAMASSIEEIEDRLEPINAILRRLEFGSTGDRLRIRLRRLTPAHVQVFMRDLRELSQGGTAEMSDESLENRFQQLSTFMRQLRRPGVAGDQYGLSTDRDRLLDVRRHVEISAERYDYATGELKASYRTLGEKSGGESQELVAFIVGSALRFRLGDEMRSRPRFAPVFLDEGFVKADSEFAGRAVEAWRGLGFQLIIGVPLDKVTGLEPHMDDLLAITKNAVTHQSWITSISDLARMAEQS